MASNRIREEAMVYATLNALMRLGVLDVWHRDEWISASMLYTRISSMYGKSVKAEVLAHALHVLAMHAMASSKELMDGTVLYRKGADLENYQREISSFQNEGDIHEHVFQLLRGEKPKTELVSPEHYSNAVAAMATAWLAAAAELATYLPLADVKSMIDIGAGSGVWSLMCAKLSGCSVLGVDLCAPAAWERTVAALELPPQSWRTDDVGAPWAPCCAQHDAAMVANVLRVLDAGNAQRALRNAAQSVRPGGLLVIVDAWGGTAAHRATYGMHLMARTGRLPHPIGLVTAWCESAGFENMRQLSIREAPGAVSALIGTRKIV